MTGEDIRIKRITHRITGCMLCEKVKLLTPSRLCKIERGTLQVSQEELVRIDKVLDKLIEARCKVIEFAQKEGYPL